jgi:ParB family chromosome partitioning protein
MFVKLLLKGYLTMAKKSFKIKSNLAQALDDTVSAAKNYSGELHVEIIPLRKIDLDPDNPRDLALTFEDAFSGIKEGDPQLEKKQQHFDSLKSLSESIIKEGIINPIVVYKYGEKYRLIAGERRTLASIISKKNDIQAKILTSKPNPFKISMLQWIENIEREDLSLWERINNLNKILAAYSEKEGALLEKISPTQISQLIGCSLQHGVNYKHVLEAPEELLLAIKEGKINNIQKAAIISKAPKHLFQTLIQVCLNGATIKELSTLASAQAKKPSKKTSKPRGRQTTQINFGTTKKANVAKIFISSVLENENFNHLHPKFLNTQWEDYKSVTDAFKLLVNILEKA